MLLPIFSSLAVICCIISCLMGEKPNWVMVFAPLITLTIYAWFIFLDDEEDDE